MVREEIRDGFEYVSMHYPFNKKKAIKIVVDTQSIEAYQEYIKTNKIEQAEIIMPNLDILKGCPSLKHLKIFPSYNVSDTFDFSPLYEMPDINFLHCMNRYGDRQQYMSEVDYSRISGLVGLSVDVNKGTVNYDKVETLKSLLVGSFKGKNRDLTDLFSSKDLDTLDLTECGVYSLNGIEKAHKMQCVYLYYDRMLRDISALSKLKGTLKALRINNCPKIEDFSVLGELENLELLELSGSNTISSLDFLKNMKNLKTFIFSINVQDGNLSPCMNLSYVYSDKDRKHYNLKNRELPKGKYVHGNENIEEWRRLE